MKKEIFINGMSCNHCKMRVEKALNSLDEVTSAEVNLTEKKALVEIESELNSEKISELIDDLGFEFVSIN